jgi:hypothetical protein
VLDRKPKRAILKRGEHPLANQDWIEGRLGAWMGQLFFVPLGEDDVDSSLRFFVSGSFVDLKRRLALLQRAGPLID